MGRCGDRHTEGTQPDEDVGVNAALSQEAPRIAGSHQQLEEAGKDSSFLRAFEGSRALPTP